MPRPSLTQSRRAVFALLASIGSLHAATASAITPTTPLVTYDGTATLSVNFHPAKNSSGGMLGAPAPTVIIASPWAGQQLAATDGDTIEKFTIGQQQFIGPMLGPASLTADGYNVVTYDARGWWDSTGEIWLDHPQKEGRDPSRIIDWLASSDPKLSAGGQRLVKLQAANDPLVGMTGVSYGGIVQLEAAANDARIDVIEPAAPIYSAVDSLYPNGVVRQGFSNLLCGSARLIGARLSDPADSICDAVNTGTLSAADVAYANTVGPKGSVFNSAYRTPTFLMGGTIDTLFPLSQTVDIYNQLKNNTSAAVKMVWGCGGHGLCSDAKEPMYSVVCAQHAWLDKYLGFPAGRASSKKANIEGVLHDCMDAPSSLTATDFIYADQYDQILKRPTYEAPTGSITASGSGTLTLSPTNSSGFVVGADEASNAVNVTIPAPTTTRQLQAAPTLTVTYKGWAGDAKTAIYAQLVGTDPQSGQTQALGNQSMPVPLTLNAFGTPGFLLTTRSVTTKLNVPLWSFRPGKPLKLQLTDYSNMFYDDNAVGSVEILSATITLPTNEPGVTPS